MFLLRFIVLYLVHSILFCTFVGTMTKINDMDIYAIQQSNGVETSSSLQVIESKAKKYAKQKKTAIITKNGNKIGWVGEDLTQRLGWGWYIQK